MSTKLILKIRPGVVGLLYVPFVFPFFVVLFIALSSSMLRSSLLRAAYLMFGSTSVPVVVFLLVQMHYLQYGILLYYQS